MLVANNKSFFAGQSAQEVSWMFCVFSFEDSLNMDQSQATYEVQSENIRTNSGSCQLNPCRLWLTYEHVPHKDRVKLTF